MCVYIYEINHHDNNYRITTDHHITIKFKKMD